MNLAGGRHAPLSMSAVEINSQDRSGASPHGVFCLAGARMQKTRSAPPGHAWSNLVKELADIMTKRTGMEFSPSVKEQAFQRNWEGSKGGGYWCEWCYFTNAQRRFFEVDHLIPVAKRGAPTLDNACILCKGCNASKNQFGFPRHGVGYAFRQPNQNMAPPSVRLPHLSWDELIMVCRRQGAFKRKQGE